MSSEMNASLIALEMISETSGFNINQYPLGQVSFAEICFLGSKVTQVEGPLKGGVSVECRGQIFCSFGCRLENHSVECRLGIITIFHAANKTPVPYSTVNFSVFLQGECRVSG